MKVVMGVNLDKCFVLLQESGLDFGTRYHTAFSCFVL